MTTLVVTRSISSAVVNRPRPKRTELCDSSSVTLRARKTYEGSRVAEVHAEPDETAIAGRSE